jgi:hypothetical protein
MSTQRQLNEIMRDAVGGMDRERWITLCQRRIACDPDFDDLDALAEATAMYEAQHTHASVKRPQLRLVYSRD